MQNAWAQYGRQPAYYPVNGFSGRFVNSINEVQPNEIPMNGSISFFPTYDKSSIYARQWNNDGTITTVRYILESQPIIDANPPAEDPYSVIMKRLDDIEKKLNHKPYYKKGESYGQSNNQNASE